MNFRLLKRAGIILLSLLFFYSPVLRAFSEPTQRIKTATDRLIEILTDSQLADPEMKEERNRKIRETVDEVFDWVAFSQRALGRHWRDLSNDQRREFVELFSKLIERTYIDKASEYSGEVIEYVREDIDGDIGSVESRIILTGGAEATLGYRVRKRSDTWYVYDILVEGVSLVNNYRGQFNDILNRSSYDELVKRLKSRIEE